MVGITELRKALRPFGNFNSITDISGLTGLMTLRLDNNSDLSDIQPLLDNVGLTAGRFPDSVTLKNTNVSCTDVALLQAKGVTVFSDCP